MRFPGNVVTLKDTRSGYEGAIGTPDKCLYCKAATGGPHNEDCVCIQRPVKVRMTLDLVLTIPRGWTKEMAEFHWNDSSSCMDNIYDQIQRHIDAHGCLCGIAEVEFIEDATLEEAISAGLKPDTEYD